MPRPLHRRPDGSVVDPAEAEAEARAPAPAPADQLLGLQQSMGNAELARVLAREPAADAPVQIGSPFASGSAFGGGPGSIVPRPLYVPPQLKPEVESAVVAWLKTHGSLWKTDGTPMPVAVDSVRRNVPEAADGNTSAIADVIRATIGNLPATRANADLGQQAAQQRASISNAFPKPPTSVTVGNAQTYVKIEIVSAELKASNFTVKADKEGGKAEYGKGDTKLGVSGKWDGSEFGIKTEVHGVKFGGKVHRKNEGWGWSGGLVIPLWGDEVDEVPDVGGAVGAAHTALVESLGHLQGGGSVTDGYVTGRMGQIKPAIDAIGEVAARKNKSGATLRVTASGDAGGFTAGVSLVIVF